jgi:hypothetical protein
VCYCDQSHGCTPIPQVNVRVMILEVGQIADCLHEPCAGRKRHSAKMCTRTLAHHPPILDTDRLVELSRYDPLGHALNLLYLTLPVYNSYPN